MSRSLLFAAVVLAVATTLYVWNADAADRTRSHSLHWVPSQDAPFGGVTPGHWARS